jgi:hypothetical protein
MPKSMLLAWANPVDEASDSASDSGCPVPS